MTTPIPPRAALLLIAAIAASFATARAEPAQPNVVLIVADDLGYGDVSCLARQVVATPNIDRIARAGVTFTQGYVTSPLCAPSRAGLLSGRYNQRVGVENNSQPGIAPDVPLFPAVFGSAGYATALLGKWHPGANQPGLRPTDRGFDEFYGYYTPFLNYHKPRLFRNGTAVTETDYSTDVFAREAEQFIERHRDRPFFLDVAFNAPHILGVHGNWRQKLKPDGRLEPNAPGEAKAPTAPPGEADKYLAGAEGDYARADAIATIVALDAAVGRILDKLRDAGLERRTIVVFLSDNGGHPENRSENLPLREFKWSVFEGGIRVPFLMAYPGVLPAGLRYDHPVISSDLLPTCTALAGVTPPPGLDGTDLTPFLTGRNAGPPHEALFWRIDQRHAVRAGQWKLIMQGRQAPLLFDLAADAEEKSDVAAAHPELVADLKTRWEAWAATLPPVPAPTAKAQQHQAD